MTMTKQEAMLKIDRARLWAMREVKATFYGRLAMQLSDVIVVRGPRACTDGKAIRWRIDAVEGWSDEQVRYVLLHETLHPAHGHLWRVPCDRTGNEAGDYEIEHVLRGIPGIKAPENILTCPPEYNGMAVETIDRALRSAQQKTPAPEPQPESSQAGDDSPSDETEDDGEGDDDGEQDAPSDGDGEGDDSPSNEPGNDSPGDGSDPSDDDGDDIPDAPSQGNDGTGTASDDGDGESDEKGESSDGPGDATTGKGKSAGNGDGDMDGEEDSDGNAPGTDPGDDDNDDDACGTFTDPAEPEFSKDDAASLKDQWERAIVQAAFATAMARGTVPGDMKQALDDIRRPATLDWRQEMAEFVRSSADTRNDWHRPARRHAWQKVIYPRRKPEPGTVVFVRDTSTSIDRAAANEFAAQINDALTICDAIVIDADASVQAEYRISRGDACPLETVGGGGTDFAPAFARVQELIDKGEPVSGVVYLTDGDGSLDPNITVEYPVLWLLTPSPWKTENRAMPFGRSVEIPR